MVRAFCRPHAYTFNEQLDGNRTDSLDWRHFRESHVTDGEQSWPAYKKIKSIKNQLKLFFHFFYFIKSETSDSFVNHFNGHFAYLKTLDFPFN